MGVSRDRCFCYISDLSLTREKAFFDHLLPTSPSSDRLAYCGWRI
jgi:hypothetical protein